MSGDTSGSEEELKCNICHVLSFTEEDHDKHVALHKNDLDCKICKKPFANKKARTKHYHVNHKEEMLNCEECDITFGKITDVDLHMKFHNKNHPYLCIVCLKSFKNLKVLRDHHTLHVKQISNSDNPFDSDTSESTSEVDEKTAIIEDNGLNSEGFMCDICGKTFTSSRTLYTHSITHRPTGVFKCDSCDKVYDTKMKVYKHIRRCHKKDKLDKDGVSQPTKKIRPLCHTCGKSFCDSRHLRRHREFHLPTGHFPCKQCDKVFELNVKLKIHMIWHRRKARLLAKGVTASGKQKPLPPCEFCGKVFTNPLSLSSHRQLHSGSYACSLCGKIFNKRWNLKTHMAIHLGHKPYSCSYCGASYADRSNLKKHLIKHPSELGAKVLVNKKPLSEPNSLSMSP